jgi:perosamine synthetase
MTTYDIKPFQYSFSEDDIEYILSRFGEILRHHGYLTMGQYGEQFEQASRDYYRAPYAIAVSSGTAALEIILKALEVAGGKVIVPTNTFGATVISILAAGATPVFADSASDLTLCPESVASKMSEDVKAVVTVHIGGLISPQTTALQAACAAWGVPLVEDAAHAAGSTLDGKHAGQFGVASAFSFFTTKLMTTGEGGMIVTRDASIDKQARLLRDHAKAEGNRMVAHGYNWRLPELQALMGIRQLQRLDEFIEKRNAVAAIYDELLGDLSQIRIIQPPAREVHNRYKYIIVLESIAPEDVKDALAEQYGIPLGGFVYEEPCHKQPAFAQFDGSGCERAEQLCASHICLPIYQEMSAAEARYVGEAVRAVLQSLHPA